MAKCRCPSPGRGACPTAAGLILKFLSATLNWTSEPVVAPSLGEVKLTSDFGGVVSDCTVDDTALGDLLELDELPQPTIAIAASRAVRMRIGVRMCISLPT